MPFVLSILTSLYLVAISKDVKRTGDYIFLVEEKFLKTTSLGWEKYLRQQKRMWFGMTDFWEYMYMFVSCVLNFLLAWFVE